MEMFESLFVPLSQNIAANITLAFETLDSLAQQYNTPKKEANSIRRVSQQSQDNEQDDQLSLFPFRSKIKQYEKINKEKITIPTQIKDIQVKPLSNLQRPYFSPKIGSWEIDIIVGINPSTGRTRLYLFAININTKYLVVIPMKDKSSDQLKIALKKLMKQVYVNNIRGDGEIGFKANVIKQLCDENHITSYFTSSPYTQHNRIVDSAIRTIRNGVIEQRFRRQVHTTKIITVRTIVNQAITGIAIRFQKWKYTDGSRRLFQNRYSILETKALVQ
ncbi:MAG: hypothetical protein EZS28_033185 [Streblomastix strix]|uniref:Integrase catalytic domain-containing protein n=1 Tax=Streblomastix strix TaxID=222440 RepID=A0A5J4ULL0_9EUKA|nr:MAG: hypothetical protein EZS28_033185 [Streblomastix strix]